MASTAPAQPLCCSLCQGWAAVGYEGGEEGGGETVRRGRSWEGDGGCVGEGREDGSAGVSGRWWLCEWEWGIVSESVSVQMVRVSVRVGNCESETTKMVRI